MICFRRVARFWGAAAVYVAGDESFTDVSILGFCREHRLASLEKWRAITSEKADEVRFLDPAVELRPFEIQSFIDRVERLMLDV